MEKKLISAITDLIDHMISVDALPKGVANKIKRAIGAPKKAETKSLDTQQGV
tara:strand:- start:144 stop:299 length:156 start_codon:yes stop_codon:yes gene_type:complete